MKTMKIYQVDAFAENIFSGNPAAVCPCETMPDPQLMQYIAAENNLSETAFYTNKNGKFDLRWFTPTAEVDLCGHATLATAHVIYSEMGFSGEKLVFNTRSGQLSVWQVAPNTYSMDFPADEITKVDLPFNFIKALGRQPIEIWKGRSDYMLIFEHVKDVRDLTPDFNLIKTLPIRGIIATAKGLESDFVSRFFAPAVGVNEDPATGSAHTSLAVYWSEKLNKTKLTAIQLSDRRGFLTCEILKNRTILTGKAHTYMRGEITIDY